LGEVGDELLGQVVQLIADNCSSNRSCRDRVPTAKPGAYNLMITATDGYGRSLKETVAIEVSD